MSRKTSGPSKKSQYANYKASSRWKENRLRKLARALKRNPGNEKQIKDAMAAVSYRRKTPNTRVWSASNKSVAGLFGSIVGYGHRDLFSFSTNQTSYYEQLKKIPKLPRVVVAKEKYGIYSIAARL